MPDGVRRIAILGGGVGALTAAYELTADPDWKQKYEVTVYSLGWRLGGKGASGRNRRQFDRIEEHGLHLWFGYYENAFALMRRCYAELGRRPEEPLATWSDAFHKQSLFVTGEFYGGRWSFWPLTAPENDEEPGAGEVATLWACLDRVLDFMHRHFVAHAPDEPPGTTEHPSWLAELLAKIETDVSQLPWAVIPLHVARELLRRAASSIEAAGFEPILRCLASFAERARAAIGAELDLDAHPEARRLLEVLELCTANVRGILADDVLRRGFDAIDDLDYRDWLAKHGAGAVALNADLLRVAYETIFAYRDGDYRQPDLAAGTALRGLLRLCFTYKGAIGWKMQAGMGDTVFAPLYLVLRRRGVRFELFSRVQQLGLSADGRRIETIRIGRQATIKQPPYEPLYPVKGLPCWPSAPLYDQLVEGTQLEQQGVDLESYWAEWTDVEEETLLCGKDFDDVVLGISIGSLPLLCRELIDARSSWQAMVENVKAVGTQAFQLWLKPDLSALGWKAGGDDVSPVLGGFAQPQNTYADMSQLIPRERWPQAPGSIAYFCGPLALAPEIPPPDDHDFPRRETERARERAEQWIASNGGILWPSSTGAGYPRGFRDVFDVAVLVGGYWRANVDPSERYVLSLSGSTKYRLAAGASGFANLVLAGDWTANGLNYGCVEAAVMSGMQAARALCGAPAAIFGEGGFAER